MDDRKLCKKCNQYKLNELFYKSSIGTNGRAFHCKECSNLSSSEKYKVKKKLLKKRDIVPIQDQHETVKKIVALLLENPKATIDKIAEEVGISPHTVIGYFNDNAYVKALRLLATRKVSSFIPLAIQGLKDSVESKNPDVKYKASVKLLENEDVIGATKVDVTVNDMRNRPISELEEIVARAKTIPQQTISEAELLS